MEFQISFLDNKPLCGLCGCTFLENVCGLAHLRSFGGENLLSVGFLLGFLSESKANVGFDFALQWISCLSVDGYVWKAAACSGVGKKAASSVQARRHCTAARGTHTFCILAILSVMHCATQRFPCKELQWALGGTLGVCWCAFLHLLYSTTSCSCTFPVLRSTIKCMHEGLHAAVRVSAQPCGLAPSRFGQALHR